MKIRIQPVLLSCVSVFAGFCVDAFADPIVIERGPHHRVVQITGTTTDQNNNLITVTNEYTELRNGFHYLENGQWLESKDLIEMHPKGATARQGPYKVIFNSNINSEGSMDMLTPDDKRIRTSVLGLGFYDTDSGKSVLFAEICDSYGKIISPNKIAYENCFSNFKADLMYTYTAGLFESDVILHQQVPSPETFGLNPDTTHLQIVTEFVEAPQPRTEDHVISQALKFSDQFIDFGAMQMGPGKAFVLPEAHTSAQKVPTDVDPLSNRIGKKWQVIDGRKILFESIPVSTVNSMSKELPKEASLKRSSKTATAALKDYVPARRGSQAPARTVVYAENRTASPSVVLDYELRNGVNNYTFQKDKTYWVRPSTNDPNLYSGFGIGPGSTIIESGAIIKYNRNAYIFFYGPITCPARGPYAVLTGVDDNENGVSLSSNVFTNNYASYALWNYYTGWSSTFNRLKIRNAQRGIQIDENPSANTGYLIQNSFFENCPFIVWAWYANKPIAIQNLICLNTPIGVYSQYPYTITNCRNTFFDPPTITTQPVGYTVNAGGTYNISVTASGYIMNYQWFSNGVSILNANDYYLRKTAVQTKDSAEYSVAVYNESGFVMSDQAVWVINGSPLIYSQPPVSQTLAAEANVYFSVGASASATLTYQWLFKPSGGSVFQNINGATAFEYTLNNAQTTDSGTYMVNVYNTANGTVYGPTASAVSALSITATRQDRVYATDADFQNGYTINLNCSIVHNQLQMNANPTPPNYVNMASGGGVEEWRPGRGSVIKIDSNTGKIVGEYRSAPEVISGYSSDPGPSRTTVDQYGNVWVANRRDNSYIDALGATIYKGSVTKHGIIIGGIRGNYVNGVFSPNINGEYLKPPYKYNTCKDKDNDGFIRTSAGINNVLAWPNANNVDDAGGVTTAQDEAVLNYVRVDPTGVRTVAVDKDNNVWVGGTEGPWWHDKLNGVTGALITRVGSDDVQQPGGCGGFVSASGDLWSAGREGHTTGLMRLVMPNLVYDLGFSHGNYGLGIDPNTEYIWHVDYSDNYVSKYSDTGTWLADYSARTPNYLLTNQNALAKAQGLVVDNKTNLWIARSYYGDTVGHFSSADGSYLGDVNLCGALGRGPIGVAVDNNGKIWVANYCSGNAMRIDPTKGQWADNKPPLGAVDMIVNLGSDAFAYNYSDMTGFITLGSTYPSGSWTFVHDGGFESQMNWRYIQWTATTGLYNGVKVDVRFANKIVDLPSSTWLTMPNNAYIGSYQYRFMEVRTTLWKAWGTIETPSSPVLTSLTITAP